MTPKRPRIDGRVALIAALGLIVAQLGAMAHAYRHVPPSAQISGQLPEPTDHQVCGECLNFAPLLTAAGAAALPAYVDPPAPGPLTLAPPASRHLHQPLRAFRSRAPPATR